MNRDLLVLIIHAAFNSIFRLDKWDGNAEPLTKKKKVSSQSYGDFSSFNF